MKKDKFPKIGHVIIIPKGHFMFEKKKDKSEGAFKIMERNDTTIYERLVPFYYLKEVGVTKKRHLTNESATAISGLKCIDHPVDIVKTKHGLNITPKLNL